MNSLTERLQDVVLRPITPDNLVGYDQFNQFIIVTLTDDGFSYSFYHDVRLLTCPICGRGWELTAESLKDQFRDYYTEKWMHKRCHVGYRALDEYRTLHRSMVIAKFGSWDFEEIPNQYGGGWNTPWYRLRLREFPGTTITFGPRKHVYHIGVSGVSKGLLEVFTEEKVTKGYDELGGFYIHAWDDEHIVACLSSIREWLFQHACRNPVLLPCP